MVGQNAVRIIEPYSLQSVISVDNDDKSMGHVLKVVRTLPPLPPPAPFATGVR